MLSLCTAFICITFHWAYSLEENTAKRLADFGEELLIKHNKGGYENLPSCPAYTYCDHELMWMENPFSESTCVRNSKKEELVNNCNQTFLFIKEGLTWTDAVSDCCKRGMRLATLENFEKQHCFSKKLIGKITGSMWWVGASDLLDKGRIQWCGLDQDLKLSPRLQLSINEKFDETNSCGSVTSDKLESYTKIQLEDCDESYYYICEEPKKSQLLDKIASMKTQNLTFGDIEPGPTVHFACGKIYIITQENLIWEESIKECCKYGLMPLSLESVEEWQCIKNAIKMDFGLFWTAGFYKNNSFTWCGSEFKFKAADLSIWAKDQPQKPELNPCLALSFEESQDNLNGLQDTPCDSDLPVICE